MKIRLNPHRWTAGMIRFVCGETGSGKTKSLTGIMIDELQNTNRVIVHCAPFELQPWVNAKGIAYPGLLETLDREFGDTFDAKRRLVELTDEAQIKQFWRCRPHIPEEPTEPTQVIWLPEISDGRFRIDGREHRGVCYIILEAHEWFPASAWTQMEKSGALSWASQNRRAGDDAWIETQFPEQVAKPFRRQSVRCRIMTNHVYLNIGPFRQPDVITYKEYRATPPDKTDPPLKGGKIEWKRGLLEACYDTGKGAGVAGTVADIGGRAKGLHWSLLPGSLFALFCIACLSLAGCRHAIVNALRGKSHLPVVAQPGQLTSTNPAPSARDIEQYVARAIARALATSSNASGKSRLSAAGMAPTREATNAVSAVTGTPGSWWVMFDDGVLVHATAVVDAGRAVVVDGVWYRRAAMFPAGQAAKRSDR